MPISQLRCEQCRGTLQGPATEPSRRDSTGQSIPPVGRSCARRISLALSSVGPESDSARMLRIPLESRSPAVENRHLLITVSTTTALGIVRTIRPYPPHFLGAVNSHLLPSNLGYVNFPNSRRNTFSVKLNAPAALNSNASPGRMTSLTTRTRSFMLPTCTARIPEPRATAAV